MKRYIFLLTFLMIPFYGYTNDYGNWQIYMPEYHVDGDYIIDHWAEKTICKITKYGDWAYINDYKTNERVYKITKYGDWAYINDYKTNERVYKITK